jgi:hypothetical protein
MTDSREKRPRGPTPPRPEPVVGTRAYDLARWLLERTARFPARLLQRGERVLSTARTEGNFAYRMLRNLWRMRARRAGALDCLSPALLRKLKMPLPPKLHAVAAIPAAKEPGT